MSVPHGPDSYYPQAQLQNVPRSAFLVWAILVALAVSALVFPKLPDTLGLSQEARGGMAPGLAPWQAEDLF